MAGSSQPGNAPAAGGLSRVAVVTAVVLIAVYIAMLAVLAVLRSDKQWDRLVFLLTGFEALVFAGGGALFGTTVQRANVTTAQTDAAQAKLAAQAERTRADEAEQTATAGRALSMAVQNKADVRARQSAGIRGARPAEQLADSVLPGPDADLEELAALARAMVPTE
jgi:hypothetical protein